VTRDDEPAYDRGGLPGIPEGGEQAIGPLREPVVTEADRKRLLEAFHGFGEGSGLPPGRLTRLENMHGDPGPFRGFSADLVIYDEAVAEEEL
jgi:hypothetical protein